MSIIPTIASTKFILSQQEHVLYSFLEDVFGALLRWTWCVVRSLFLSTN